MKPLEYWDLTLGQFESCLNGYKDHLESLDHLNLLLGSYIAVGVNNPKKYPKKGSLSQTKPAMQPIDQFRRFAKQNYSKD